MPKSLCRSQPQASHTQWELGAAVAEVWQRHVAIPARQQCCQAAHDGSIVLGSEDCGVCRRQGSW